MDLITYLTNATALIFHGNHLITFLENFYTLSNMKLKSVLMDIRDDKIMNLSMSFFLSALSLSLSLNKFLG